MQLVSSSGEWPGAPIARLTEPVVSQSLALQAEAHRSLREQLKKQFEIQQEVLQEKVASKEKEVSEAPGTTRSQ